ncbi:MAG: AmmeMemoRadiSam system protein B [Pseudomonadota bacterium]
MERKHMSLAGTWYPDSPGKIKEEIRTFLSGYTAPGDKMFTGGVVPHAGWYFSGSIACRVWASLTAGVDTVVLFGMHMLTHSRPCVLTRGGLATPLGDLPVNESLASALAGRTGASALTPGDFPDENTLEIQLPFVKYFFPDAAIVTAGVPADASKARAMGEVVVDAARELGISIVVVGSTDLTHYGSNFGFTPMGQGSKALDWVTRHNDRMAVDALLARGVDSIVSQGLANHNLCCPGAAAAATAAAVKMGSDTSVEVAYATSYDMSPGTSFVGYAGVLYGKHKV